MPRARIFLLTLLIFHGAIPSNAQTGIAFPTNGPLPFESIAYRKHRIDQQCGPMGETSNPVKQAQNLAKNNFWSANEAVSMNFSDFLELENQTNAKIKSGTIETVILKEGGSGKVYPADRNQLTFSVAGKNLREGTVVVLEGFLLDAHYSNTKYNDYGGGDVGGGESVNCNQAYLTWNDIHISLGETRDAKKCYSVTAEISPHFRPISWARFHDQPNDKSKIKKLVNGLPLRGKKFRLTGTLFYDASHKPCTNGNFTGDSARVSIWEIHPVYRIQVEIGGNWMELDDWATDK